MSLLQPASHMLLLGAVPHRCCSNAYGETKVGACISVVQPAHLTRRLNWRWGSKWPPRSSCQFRGQCYNCQIHCFHPRLHFWIIVTLQSTVFCCVRCPQTKLVPTCCLCIPCKADCVDCCIELGPLPVSHETCLASESCIIAHPC